MKTYLVIALALFMLPIAAQTIKTEKGVATLDDVDWLIVQETPLGTSANYVVLKTLAGEIIAKLSFTNNPDKVYFKGDFPTVAKKYETNYPVGTGIQTILESFNKNGIIVAGKIDLVGLQKYCDDRKIALNKILTYDEEQAMNANATTVLSFPAQSNAGQTASNNAAAVAAPQMVTFSLKNNSSKTVRIFIGTEPKFGSGSTHTTGGNNLSTEHGKAGDKLCIVDEQDNPISCTTISEGMGRLEINSSGTGFGN